MTAAEFDALLTPSVQFLLDLAKDAVWFVAGMSAEAIRQHRKRLREAKKRAIQALTVLVGHPNVLITKGLPMEALQGLESVFVLRRNRLRKAMARCETARQDTRQDEVGQPMLADPGEAEAALRALLKELQ